MFGTWWMAVWSQPEWTRLQHWQALDTHAHPGNRPGSPQDKGWVLLAIAHTDKQTELVLLPHATATKAGTSIPTAGTTFSAP